MKYHFRKATPAELPEIWTILQGAILRRKEDGSSQWQDGYPNMDVVKNDMSAGAAFVLKQGETVVGYTAVFVNNEPEYANIKGQWLSNEDFLVFHRIAISQEHLGQGLAKKMVEFIEDHARSLGIRSIKADTNFDNMAMLHIFAKGGYTFCGEVYFRGSARKAFEKVLLSAQ